MNTVLIVAGAVVVNGLLYLLAGIQVDRWWSKLLQGLKKDGK